MEIKSQNLPKMSKEQLYRLIVQEDISDADRQKIKSELVKREAENLYNQSQRVRGTEITSITSGKPAGGPVSQKMRPISPAVWVTVIFLVILIGFGLYFAFVR